MRKVSIHNDSTLIEVGSLAYLGSRCKQIVEALKQKEATTHDTAGLKAIVHELNKECEAFEQKLSQIASKAAHL